MALMALYCIDTSTEISFHVSTPMDTLTVVLLVCFHVFDAVVIVIPRSCTHAPLRP